MSRDRYVVLLLLFGLLRALGYTGSIRQSVRMLRSRNSSLPDDLSRASSSAKA